MVIAGDRIVKGPVAMSEGLGWLLFSFGSNDFAFISVVIVIGGPIQNKTILKKFIVKEGKYIHQYYKMNSINLCILQFVVLGKKCN